MTSENTMKNEGIQNSRLYSSLRFFFPSESFLLPLLSTILHYYILAYALTGIIAQQKSNRHIRIDIDRYLS